MNEARTDEGCAMVELEYRLDDPPQKVWRAISIAEFRDVWLPGACLADPDACAETPGQEIQYRLRDDHPPFLESTVTFRIAPDGTGGTSLRIIHRLDATALGRVARAAANRNGPPLSLAA